MGLLADMPWGSCIRMNQDAASRAVRHASPARPRARSKSDRVIQEWGSARDEHTHAQLYAVDVTRRNVTKGHPLR
jgi:hypothetical protein